MLLIFAAAYVYYFYSYKNNWFYSNGTLIALAFSFVGLGSVWFNFNKYTQRALSRMVWLFYTAVCVAVVFALFHFEKEREKSVLKNYGVEVKAVIFQKKRVSKRHMASIAYIYNQKTYLHDITDDRSYNLYDTLLVSCSSLDPEMVLPVAELKE